MTSTQIWLAIFGMTFVTALTRAMFLIGGERTVLPERVQRMLRYAPAAALPPWCCPTCWPRRKGCRSRRPITSFTRRCPVSAWFLWRRTMLGTIVVGMVVFTLLRLFV